MTGALTNQVHYIDTRVGAGNLFAPPSPVADYAAWLRQRYQNGMHNPRLCCGVAQRINQLLFAARHRGLQLYAHGPYAGQVAAVIEELSGHAIEVEVLG